MQDETFKTIFGSSKNPSNNIPMINKDIRIGRNVHEIPLEPTFKGARK
jgi:hypothetical protein